MLIPARTDTSYFHDYIFHGKADEVRFIRREAHIHGRGREPDQRRQRAAVLRSLPFGRRDLARKDMAQSLRDMVLDLIKDRDMTANEIAATLSDRGQQVSRSDVARS